MANSRKKIARTIDTMFPEHTISWCDATWKDTKLSDSGVDATALMTELKAQGSADTLQDVLDAVAA